jgi:uncharacterized membrane protein YhaH (DUF805 family)
MDVGFIINNYRSAIMEHYFDFQGRVDRPTFWYFVLVNFIIGIILGIIDGIIGTAIIGELFNLAVLLPSIGIGVRRMHDINRSGWWVLLPFANIYWWCQPGTAGANQFGADPKAGGATGAATATA